MFEKRECIRQLALETDSLHKRYPQLLSNVRRRGNSLRTLIAFRNYHKWNTQKDMKCIQCDGHDRCQIHHIDGDFRNCLIENLQSLCHNCHQEYHSINGKRKGIKMSPSTVVEVNITLEQFGQLIKMGVVSPRIVDMEPSQYGVRGILKRWTEYEHDRLVKIANSSGTRSSAFRKLAKELGRSVSSIEKRYYTKVSK